MGLYRIWLSPGRKGLRRPDYYVDVEARDLKHAKAKANESPFWTGEITTLRSGDSSRDPGRSTHYVHVYGEDVRAMTLAELHRAWDRKWAEPDTEGLRIIREEVRRRGLSPRWCASWGNARRHGNAMSRRGYLREFKVSKIHLDRGGYDHRGRYYGVGMPLYRVICEDGEVIVRARSAREARAEALRRPDYWGGWR